MKWIVGLGNPGSEYENTRHNLGFCVVDEIGQSQDLAWKAGKGEYMQADSRYHGEDIALVKPLTYVNNSGVAVADLVQRYEVALEDILIVCDDVSLPLGLLRLRPKGSDGGHNGLYSIIYQLQTGGFPRLRCGIGSDRLPMRKDGMTEHVLSVFDPDERPVVRRMIARAAQAALCHAVEGIERAMNRYNQPIS